MLSSSLPLFLFGFKKATSAVGRNIRRVCQKKKLEELPCQHYGTVQSCQSSKLVLWEWEKHNKWENSNYYNNVLKFWSSWHLRWDPFLPVKRHFSNFYLLASYKHDLGLASSCLLHLFIWVVIISTVKEFFLSEVTQHLKCFFFNILWFNDLVDAWC